MTSLGITLTSIQERAIRTLLGVLDRTAACYQFTGGFAGNLHGSHWPLHDVDVDIAKQDLGRVCNALERYTYHPLSPYEDAEFRIYLMRARIDGVEIDVSQAEEAYGRAANRWAPLGTELTNRQSVPLFDRQVWVQPLDALIAYKSLIGRAADVADLTTLLRARDL